MASAPLLFATQKTQVKTGAALGAFLAWEDAEAAVGPASSHSDADEGASHLTKAFSCKAVHSKCAVQTTCALACACMRAWWYRWMHVCRRSCLCE